MGVRLNRDQRDAVRREFALQGAYPDFSHLAYDWAEERTQSAQAMIGKVLDYYEAILNYRDWLERNHRTARAQARATN